MQRWLWKIVEILAAAILLVFMLVPTYLEKEFVRDLYTEHPVLCVMLLVAGSAFVIATLVHWVVEEQRKKKSEKTKAMSGNDMLGLIEKKREEKC
jgi:branched-subunit amino acid ABC-type transport system permease component